MSLPATWTISTRPRSKVRVSSGALNVFCSALAMSDLHLCVHLYGPGSPGRPRNGAPDGLPFVGHGRGKPAARRVGLRVVPGSSTITRRPTWRTWTTMRR